MNNIGLNLCFLLVDFFISPYVVGTYARYFQNTILFKFTILAKKKVDKTPFTTPFSAKKYHTNNVYVSF